MMNPETLADAIIDVAKTAALIVLYESQDEDTYGEWDGMLAIPRQQLIAILQQNLEEIIHE